MELLVIFRKRDKSNPLFIMPKSLTVHDIIDAGMYALLSYINVAVYPVPTMLCTGCLLLSDCVVILWTGCRCILERCTTSHPLFVQPEVLLTG